MLIDTLHRRPIADRAVSAAVRDLVSKCHFLSRHVSIGKMTHYVYVATVIEAVAYAIQSTCLTSCRDAAVRHCSSTAG